MWNQEYVTRYETWFLLKNAIRKLKGMGLRNKIPKNGLGRKGDCDWNPLRRGSNFDKNRKPGANRNLWFLRKQISEHTKWRISVWIAVSRVSNKIPRVATSSFAGGAQAVFYGFGMARMLKCLLAELLFWNIGVGVQLSWETITPR